MKRTVLFLILVVFTMTGSMAQLRGIGRGAVRSSQQVRAAGERLMRQVQQQSQRASQAARKAASVGTHKPSGMRVVAVPNLDNDDQKREQRNIVLPEIRPISPKSLTLKRFPKLKSYRERKDEKIAADYDSIVHRVLEGVYDDMPFRLLQYADYAKRYNDEVFAMACLLRINTKLITPDLLEYVARRYAALEEYLPELSRAVAINAYEKMVLAKCAGVDCDSARMQNGDTLLIVTDQYNPSLNPLVVLSCFYHPSREIERYKETADSVAATYDQWPEPFKDTFARDFEITLMEKGDYAAVLDYFGREPFKQFPDSIADFDIDLATCAMYAQNDSLFGHYLRQALELDSVAAENYWAQLYGGIRVQFAADPSQTDLADWLIENSPEPAGYALDLSVELMEQFSSDEDFSWKWETLSDYTPERETVRRAILHMLDKGIAIDEGRSGTEVIPYISYLKAEMLMADPAMTAEAKSLLDDLASSDVSDMRCRAVIGQAYIAGHGLDNPKEAMKILKKKIKLLEDPSVNNYTRGMWYEYMGALATRLGKIKDAERYLKLKSEMK